jgi:hypothetical protein
MGKILFRDGGYRFIFIDDEPRMHVVAYKWDGEAKFWLEPQVELEGNEKLARIELEDLQGLIHAHLEQLKELWRERHPAAGG